MELIKRVLLSLIVIMLLTSCSPASKTPPYLGVFLRDGSNFTPLDKFTGPPDTTPKVSVDVSNPTFTAWLEGFDAQNFLLVSYTSADRIKNQVAFNLRPLQEDEMYDILVDELPGPDVYCFTQVDPLSVVYRLTHWCFAYAKVMVLDEFSTTEKNFTPVPKPETETKSTNQPQPTWGSGGGQITPGNASRISELSSIGNGVISDYDFSPDGTTLVVAVGTKLLFYPSSKLDLMREIDTGFTISRMEYSRDGKILIFTSPEKLHIWRTQDLLQNCSVKIHNINNWIGPIISPDGSKVAVIEERKFRISMYDVNNCSLISSLSGHTDYISDFSFSPNSQYMVSNSIDQTIRLWNIYDGSIVRVLNAEGSGPFAFSPNGQLFAYVSDKRSICVWKFPDWVLVNEFGTFSDPLQELFFSPDGEMLASKSSDIRLWKSATGKNLYTFEGDEIVGFTPDGVSIVIRKGKSIVINNIDNGKTLSSFNTDIVPIFIKISPDSQALATLNYEGNFQIWRTTDGELLDAIDGYGSGIQEIAISPDGEILAVAYRGYINNSYMVQIWQINNENLLRVLKHSNPIYSLVFSPDGQLLASREYGGTVNLYNTSDWTLLKTYQDDLSVNQLESMVFSPDGLTLLTVNEDRKINEWSLSDAKLMRSLESRCHGNLHFTPDGKIVVCHVYGDVVDVINVGDGKRLFYYEGKLLNISPDGQILAIYSSDRGVNLIHTLDGGQILQLQDYPEGNFLPLDATFSTDGKLLAIAIYGDSIRSWRVSDGALLTTLTYHTDAVSSLEFSPDGKFLISGSLDGTVRFWGVTE